MHATTAPAVPDTKQGRPRALCAAGGALAAALAWIVEVPLLGIHLNVRFGTGHIQTIPVGQVIGATVAASLAGWLLLTLLERRTRHARLLWTTIAVAALAASLALPLAAATTTSAAVGLIVMHLTVGAAVIPAMAHTARAR
jgi:predicted permease